MADSIHILDSFLSHEGSEIILDTLREGVVIADSRRTVRYANHATESITKLAADRIVGQPIGQLLALRLTPDADPYSGVLETGLPFEMPAVDWVRSDGIARVLALTLRRIGSPPDYRLLAVFQDITDQHRLREAATQRFSYFGLTTRDPRILEIFRLIDQTADSPAPALISGETGTGKETVARAMHLRGARIDRPFVALSCVGMPPDLLESDLFGGGKPAPSGERIGRLEQAAGGTLYLEEVSELPPPLQQKLLQLLQGQTFSRAGETRTRRSDARIIAATSRDLRRIVAEGHFREDLWYRLRVIPIHLPPLRDRREDIPLLVQHFMERFKRRYGRDVSGVSEKALSELMGCPWPGNVTEIERAVEYAFVRCGSDTIERKDLPPEILAGPAAKPSRPVNLLRTLSPDQQKKVIEEALKETKGNRLRAAALLGITRVTLWKKLKLWNIRASGRP